MDIHLELAEFLMNDLAATYEDFSDDSHFVFSVTANIATYSSNITESMLKLYVAPVCELVDPSIVQACVAFFHGANLLSVGCDCTDSTANCYVTDIENNTWYGQGIAGRLDESAMYTQASFNIMSLRSELML